MEDSGRGELTTAGGSKVLSLVVEHEQAQESLDNAPKALPKQPLEALLRAVLCNNVCLHDSLSVGASACQAFDVIKGVADAADARLTTFFGG